MTELEKTIPESAKAAKKTIDEIIKEIAKVKEKIRTGQKYYHYKDKSTYYTVTNVTMDTKTQKPIIHYFAFYKQTPVEWSRPLDDFSSHVTIDGAQIPKFRKVK